MEARAFHRLVLAIGPLHPCIEIFEFARMQQGHQPSKVYRDPSEVS